MHLLLEGVAVQQRADRPRPRRGRKKVVEETRALMLMRCCCPDGAVALPLLALALMTDGHRVHVSFAVGESGAVLCSGDTSSRSSHPIADAAPLRCPSLHHPTDTDTFDPYYYSATLLCNSLQNATLPRNPTLPLPHHHHLHSIAATLQ